MILLRIVEHDLHRARNENAVPLYIETPARAEFLPAVISNSRGGFLVARRIFPGNYVRSGIFSYDPDKLDGLVGPMLTACFDLSRAEKWENVFPQRPKGAEAAYDYVRSSSGLETEPRFCLIPESWSPEKLQAFLGKKADVEKYKGTARVVACNVSMPVFLSRPDMVGLYTQFVGGLSSLLLHNVRRGMSFCSP